MAKLTQTRNLDGIMVQRINIIGTRILVYSAWELSSPMGAHSSITTFDGTWYGEIKSRRLPAWMDALPAYSDERSRIVGEYHEANYDQSYELICRAFPEACMGEKRDGEITVQAEELAEIGIK